MNVRAYLLEIKGIADEEGNRVYFSDRGLDGEVSDSVLWMFLDEGMRCGGISREVEPTGECITEVLVGCRKYALAELVRREIMKAAGTCE